MKFSFNNVSTELHGFFLVQDVHIKAEHKYKPHYSVCLRQYWLFVRWSVLRPKCIIQERLKLKAFMT